MTFWERFIPELISGIFVTLQILAITIPVSIAWGIVLGSLRIYGGRFLSRVSAGIVGLFRGFPLIVTLLLLFYGLPEVGIFLSPYWTAVLAFILCSGAYQSEYVRGAIRSIDVGQIHAARSLGMTKLQEWFNIVLPQALRGALPGISNEIIYQIKYSSLAYIVGVSEIFAISKSFNSIYFRPIEIFLTAAAIYIIMNTIATIAFRLVENKLRIPGLEVEV